MKRIDTQGVTYIEPIGGGGWYFGMTTPNGDLYEAEELYRDGHPIRQNRLVLIHYPEGRTVQPVPSRPGRYFGHPVYDVGQIILLYVDFPEGQIHLETYDPGAERTAPLAVISLSEVEDCYNLMLRTSPPMLTRQADDKLQIIWPERAEFDVDPAAGFCFREGERPYFSAWREDPDYHEDTVVVDCRTGEVVERLPDTAPMALPDGQGWILG